MENVLTILEVSRKQEYIFASKKLRENAERSQDIAQLTGSSFFQAAAGELYSEADNLVNTGGGHAVLQFDSRNRAVEFAKRVTQAALEDYPELELFVKTIGYDPAKTPGENLKALTSALEEKKALRKSSFRRVDFGVERLADADMRPRPDSRRHRWDVVPPPDGFRYFSSPDDLKGEQADNFIAVVHIDGNNMGARVGELYKQYPRPEDWEACRKTLQAFSESIQKNFEDSFAETAEAVSRWCPAGELLPIRPIILAGDDVCFVTAGKIGLECARLFMEALAKKENVADHQSYSACAGVAIVHQKYPFHRAYDLAEELCDNAKKFGAELDPDRRVSAMDWHIEFGQLKDSLSALREDYQTEDGNRLELRPVVVEAPEGISFPRERSYQFFRKLCGALKGEYGRIARSKLKELRTALKQGEVESRFFLQDKEIGDLLYAPLDAAYSLREWEEAIKKKGAFRIFEKKGGKAVCRCLFFDAIELIDHFVPCEEVSQ